MDAVILAAGDGTRLKGIAARGHKPLLLVNGIPLVVSVTRAALEFADQAFVVTSPLNHEAINELLEANHLTNWMTMLRDDTRGPGDSLLGTLQISTASDALVLCADNILSTDDVGRIATTPGEVIVGGRRESDWSAAQRFTRIDCLGISMEDLTWRGQWPDGDWRVWLGPLRVPCQRAVEVLLHEKACLSEGELKIGPYLSQIGDVSFVEVDAYDVGIPEVWAP